MKLARMLVVAVALESVIAGSATGVRSILENEYWKHGFHVLAFDEWTTWIDRLFYVLVIAGGVFAAILIAVHRCMKSVWKLALVLAAVVAFGVSIEACELDYRADLVWIEMPREAHIAVIALFLIYVDLVVGRQWLGFLAGKAVWRAAVACAAIAVVMNIASAVWFSRLQQTLADKPNILIITVDALRADHVRCLGYARDTTPTIDALAASGVLFTQAASNSNATRSTVPAIFTMLNPSVHGIMGADGRVLSPRFVTLAERMKNRGYATLAYMPNGPLRRIFNIGQGFDVYEDRILGLAKLERFDSAVPINASIHGWLDDHASTKFFMYIHYIEPHTPYQPPQGYDRMFYGPEAAEHVRPIADAELQRMERHAGEAAMLEINDVNFYMAQYDAEVRYTDDQIKVLLDLLQEHGVLDDTAIFVTADHGEAFFEHGHWMHTTSPLYEEVVHVPLVARLPRSDRKGLRLEAPVHTFDIGATILELVGIASDGPMQAKSFLPVIRGEIASQWEYTFSEAPQDKVLRNKDWKFRVSRKGQELYYLPDDPLERKNLALERKEQSEAMMRLMTSFVQANNTLSGGREVETTAMDKGTIDQLKALGYTQ